MTKIITAWKDYVDIDAEACGMALYEVKRLLGEDVELQLVAIRSFSLPTCVTNRWYTTQTVAEIPAEAELILVDVSHKEYLNEKCGYNLDKIIEIYDHHFESISYRKEILGDRAVIEPVGACATLITELAVQHKLLEQLSDNAIKLLYTAIISHTLNFQVGVTTERDRKMSVVLRDIINKRKILSSDWIQHYFQEVEQGIQKNPLESIHEDLKSGFHFGKSIFTYTIGQLELRNGHAFVETYKDDIIQEVVKYNDSNHLWFVTVASIEEGKNYLICTDARMQGQLSKITWVVFHDDIAITDKLRLRKEFVRELMKF